MRHVFINSGYQHAVEPRICHPNHKSQSEVLWPNHNLEALNATTRTLSEACLLGTIPASYPKSVSGHTTFAEAPRKVRGRSAEARNAKLDANFAFMSTTLSIIG